MVYCTGGRPEKVSSFRGVSCPSCSCPSYRSRINERPFASRRPSSTTCKGETNGGQSQIKRAIYGIDFTRNPRIKDATWTHEMRCCGRVGSWPLTCFRNVNWRVRTCKDECVVEIRVFFLHPTSWKNACVHFTTWLRARHFHLTFLREMRGKKEDSSWTLQILPNVSVFSNRIQKAWNLHYYR